MQKLPRGGRESVSAGQIEFVAEGIPELTIGVAERARGTGVGSALLAALLDMADERGCGATSLSVEDGNAARRLYERAGFAVVGRNGGSDTLLRHRIVPLPILYRAVAVGTSAASAEPCRCHAGDCLSWIRFLSRRYYAHRGYTSRFWTPCGRTARSRLPTLSTTTRLRVWRRGFFGTPRIVSLSSERAWAVTLRLK